MDFTTKDTKNTKDSNLPEWRVPLEPVARDVVDAAFRVHKNLGPGLLESIYEACMLRELTKKGVPVRRQVPVPIVYDGETIETPLKLDLVAADQIVIELKSVERILPIHEAQLLTYLKVSNRRIGFLMNFNVLRIKDGIRRFIL